MTTAAEWFSRGHQTIRCLQRWQGRVTMEGPNRRFCLCHCHKEGPSCWSPGGEKKGACNLIGFKGRLIAASSSLEIAGSWETSPWMTTPRSPSRSSAPSWRTPLTSTMLSGPAGLRTSKCCYFDGLKGIVAAVRDHPLPPPLECVLPAMRKGWN